MWGAIQEGRNVSDPYQPARVRPGVVTISSYLIFFYAALSVFDVIMGLTTLGTVQEIYREEFAGTDAEGSEGVVVVTVAVMSLVSLLFAVGMVVLALLNNRGKRVARIVTWAVGGFALCCVGVSLAVSAAGNAMSIDDTSGDMASQEEIERRLAEALPSWYEPMLTSALGAIALVAALILLALPPANEYFRKPQQQWEPPVPGAVYPGAPGGGPAYPVNPGQPGYPQAGPPPGQPGHPQAGPPPGQPGHPQADPPPGQPGSASGSSEQGGGAQSGSDGTGASSAG
ncbi:hypothetical protein [Salinispora arenicola]|uniref:hypothetical protein n=1 Tax=Salinispora arenicola TaxID=168697 RepID=UPI00207A8B07|nr:hypothetical protein [Salinispora arenicola]MCN0180933.1 hypothetical protein [Salinispora arenicola]